MRPLDVVAIPRAADVITTMAPRRAADKLTAELTERPDATRAIVYAVDGDGGVFTLSGTGERCAVALGDAWLPLQVAASTTGEVWLLAKDRGLGAGAFAVLRRDGDDWSPAYRLSDAGRPVIGGGAGGFWLFAGGGLSFIVDGKAAAPVEALDFEPVDISEGVDGTLWLVGGTKRYGGLEVRRRLDEGNGWFLLPPPAAATSLAVAPDGSAWSVSTKGEVWRLSRDGAGTFRECGLDADCRRCFYKPDRTFARAVTASRDGNLWFLSGNAGGTGYAIERMLDLGTRESEAPAPDARAISIAATLR